MKKARVGALLLTAVLLLGGCVGKGKDKGSSSASSQPGAGQESGAESSKINDMFPESSEPEVSSEPVSSGGEESAPESNVAASAVPTAIGDVTLPDLSGYDTKQVTWGPGHQMDDANRPVACIGLQEKYGRYGGCFLMPGDEKKVYLTFDEGYENGYTSKILDVLKEKECPAVFFVTYDYVKRNADLVQRMIDEGHVVGNHTMNHPNLTKLDADAAVKEISDLHNYVVENFNYQMTLFRPPEGAFSQRSLVIANTLGYKTVLWSFAYNDWNPDAQMEPQKALAKVTSCVHNGAIPLLHAVSSTNTAILGDVIDSWRGQGYTMEKLQ